MDEERVTRLSRAYQLISILSDMKLNVWQLALWEMIRISTNTQISFGKIENVIPDEYIEDFRDLLNEISEIYEKSW